MSRSALDDYECREYWERAGFKIETDWTRKKLGINMEPYNGLCDGQPCPCNRAHELNPTVEAVVFYNGRVWAYNCALKELVLTVGTVMLEVLERRIEDKEARSNLLFEYQRIRDSIRQIVEVMKSKLLTHEEGCRAIEAAAAMRGNAVCTCNYQKINETLAHLAKG